jgi:MYXO-CTERM domain-containing protein
MTHRCILPQLTDRGQFGQIPRMLDRRFWLCAVALTFAGSGCVPGAGIGERGSAIINGVASGSEDDFAVGIGIFTGGQFSGACSGVLVAPNVVLTARHCVSNTVQGGIACDQDGNSIAGGDVLADFAPGDLGILVGPVLGSVSSHAKQIFHTDATNLCDQDIAALLLDTPITNAPFAQIRLDTQPVVGELVAAIGWGVSNNSNGYGRRRRDNIPITLVGPANGIQMGLMQAGPNEFLIGEGICEGDSGGPAIDMQTRAVVGLVSRGGNGAPQDPMNPSASCVDSAAYKSQNVYTRPDGFKDFINTVFTAAGTDPWVEGGPDPRKAKFGESCTGPDSCRSAICVAALAGGNICSQSCTGADGTCPDGYLCTPFNGGGACTEQPPPAPPPASGCAVGGDGAPIGALALAWLLALVGLGVRRRSTRRG